MEYQFFCKIITMDRPQGVRERISSLKQYIRSISEQIPTAQPQQKFTPVWRIPNRAVVSAPPSEISIQLLKQIQSLTERIEKKRKRFTGHATDTQRILKGPTQTLPFIASCFISKVIPQGSLNSIVNKIEPYEWKKCSIYTKKNLLILVLDSSFQIYRLDLLCLQERHASVSNGLIKIVTARPEYFVILSIPDASMLSLWSSYLRSFQILSRHSDPINQKWNTTSIKCKMPGSKQLQPPSEPKQQYRINVKKEKTVRNDSEESNEKKQRSGSLKDDNLQADPSPVEGMQKKRLSSNSSLKSQKKVMRSSVGQKQQKINHIILQKTVSQQSKESGETLLKLQEKRKKLIEGGLNIYWHQQEEKYPDLKERISIRAKNTSGISNSNASRDNLKNSSTDSKKDRRSVEIADKKRHDSETRGELDSRFQDDKSVSRGGGKTEIFGSRKYIGSPSQSFPDFSEQNPGSSTKKKHSIQRQILKKVMPKNSLIKEEQSRSSQTKNIQNLEASLKEKSERIHISKQEHSKAVFLQKTQEYEDDDDSYESSDDETDSEFSQMDLHELKSGIVLWKCSPNGWKPHEKKLYLAESELELCYCDILDAREQKKYFIRDIVEVKEGNQGIGIIKHFGNVDVERCLMITVNQANENKEKKKCLQFYLGENEAPENLKDFTKKLKTFLDVKKRGDEDADNLEEDL